MTSFDFLQSRSTDESSITSGSWIVHSDETISEDETESARIERLAYMAYDSGHCAGETINMLLRHFHGVCQYIGLHNTMNLLR